MTDRELALQIGLHIKSFKYWKRKFDPSNEWLDGKLSPINEKVVTQIFCRLCRKYQDISSLSSSFKIATRYESHGWNEESVKKHAEGFDHCRALNLEFHEQFDVLGYKTTVTKIRKKLQLSYKKLILPALFPWLPRGRVQLQEYVRHVMMSETIINADGITYNRTETVRTDQIFEYVGGSRPTRIQLQDTVGFNCTAIAVALCRSWAMDEEPLASTFDLVLFFQGRELESTSLKDLIVNSCRVDEVDNDEISDVFKINPKVLIVLDDIGSVDLEKAKDLLPVLQSQTYADATLVATSVIDLYSSSAPSPFLKVHSTDLCAKVLKVRGMPPELEHKFLLNNLAPDHMDLVSQTSELQPFFSNDALKNPIFLLLAVRVFSQVDIQNARTKSEAFKIIFQSLVNTFYFPTSQEPDLFEFDPEDIPIVAKLLSEFGELALCTIHENAIDSKPKRVWHICDIHDLIHDLGLFLYTPVKNLRQIKKPNSIMPSKDRCEVELLHPILLDFIIAYHLWFVFYTESREIFLRRLEFFRSELACVSSARESTISSFLFGLVGHKLELLIESMQEFPYIFGDWISILLHESPNAIIDLGCPFIVHYWKHDRVQLTISALCLHTIPHHLYVKRLCLEFSGVEVMQCRPCKCFVRCDQLWCVMKGSAKQGEEFLSLLKELEFQKLSLIISQETNEYFNNWLPLFHDELLNGDLRNRRLNYLCLHVPLDAVFDVIPLLRDLLHHEVISALQMTLLPSISVTNLNKWNSHAEFVLRLKYALPELVLPDQKIYVGTVEDNVTSLIESIGKSRSLHSIKLCLPFNSTDVTIDLNRLFQNGRKLWRSVELSQLTVTCTILAKTGDISYLDLSTIRDPELTASMLLSCKVRAIRTNTHNLETLLHHARKYDNSLVEVHIVVNTRDPEIAILYALEHFVNVQTLSITLNGWSVNIAGDVVLSISRRQLRLKGIEIFDAHSNEAQNFVFQLVQHLHMELSSEGLDENSLLPLRLNYLLFRFVLDTDFLAYGEDPTDTITVNFLDTVALAKEPLTLMLLKQIHVVCKAGALHKLKSLQDIFPKKEGFCIRQDFWGMREDDTEFSKCSYGFAVSNLWYRHVITFV